MSRVVKTLVQSLVFFAIVISPVTVLAIQIPNDFESIPDALEEELVPQDAEDSQQAVADSQPVSDSQQSSVQSDTGDSRTSESATSQAQSMSAAVAEGMGPAELRQPVGASLPRVSAPRVSFSSPGRWHKKAPVSFLSHSPTVSLGSGSGLSLCCDIAGGGDISSLMVFAQPRPFASVAEVGSLTQFVDSSAGFSQSLAPAGRQSGQNHESGRSVERGNSSRARGSETVNHSTNRLPRLSGGASSSGACGCVGGGCDSESSSNIITAMIRMVTQFANCLISGD